MRFSRFAMGGAGDVGVSGRVVAPMLRHFPSFADLSTSQVLRCVFISLHLQTKNFKFNI